MSAALLCLAGSLIVLPASEARGRLIALTGTERARSRLRVDVRLLSGLLCVPALLVAGVPGAVACAALLATVHVRVRRGRRDREQQAQRRGLLDGLDIVIGELRIGAHPASACEAAASECSGTAGEALATASARSRLGGSAAEGLRRTESSIGPELQRIATAWGVAERHGIALAELLDAARSDLQGRMRFRSRTESGLAGARATGTVLAGLPVLGIALGQLMGAAPLRVLFGGGLGGVLLVIGTVLACAGLLWTDAITARVTA